MCCDDYLQPCFCYAYNFDDYDDIKKQREERLREIERWENASPETLAMFRAGKLRYVDVVRPIPDVVRRYPRHTWRTSNKVEDIVRAVVHDVASAERGVRNNTLARSAWFFGKLVQSGRLDIEHAVYQLGQAARNAGLPLHEAATTVRLGLQAGMRQEAQHPYERPAPLGRGTTRTHTATA